MEPSIINVGISKVNELFLKSNFQEKLKIQNRSAMKKLIFICCFCCSFMTIEFIGGYFAGSLAIMTDAAHLLSDLAGFLISMFSLYIATKPANGGYTYGYHRAEVIGAMCSILIIWLLTIWLITEAIQRILHPHEIKGKLMILIASLGLIFNIIMSQILSYNPLPNAMDGQNITNITNNNENNEEKKMNNCNEDEEDSDQSHLIKKKSKKETEENKTMNANKNLVIRAAYIHIIGDMIQSLGVLIAAIIIEIFQNNYQRIRIVDPICTFIFAIIVLCTTIPVSINCFAILMETTPDGISIEEFYEELLKINDIIEVHDIHIWSISVGRNCITAHIVSKDKKNSLKSINELCKKYNLNHSTIQIEEKDEGDICTCFENNNIH
ncbi:MAG: cation diffusion facilitator family transporter [archaeon]|nr:cation diffusion facilitator family transporter [archaeon]